MFRNHLLNSRFHIVDCGKKARTYITPIEYEVDDVDSLYCEQSDGF